VLDHASNQTGHFDIAIDSTYVAVGSQVTVDGKNYFITVTDGTGTSANSITLSESVPSGRVDFIGAVFTWVPAPVNTIMPAGFTVAAITHVTVNGETFMFEAEHGPNR
jgi:hypothetical protein